MLIREDPDWEAYLRRRVVHLYNPDQPRVESGPDAGQWGSGGGGSGINADKVGRFQSQWNHSTATDEAVTLRSIAAQAYGGDVVSYSIAVDDPNNLGGKFGLRTLPKDEISSRTEDWGKAVGAKDAVAAFKEHVEEQRQTMWSAMGREGKYDPDATVTLYRGMRRLPEEIEEGSNIGIRAGAASSWTTDERITENFSQSVSGGKFVGVVVKAEVPFRNILGSHHGGWGHEPSREVVVNDRGLKGSVRRL